MFLLFVIKLLHVVFLLIFLIKMLVCYIILKFKDYFIKNFLEDLPYTKVPLHTVIKLTPMAYGCLMECIPLAIEAVNTHREKPKVR